MVTKNGRATHRRRDFLKLTSTTTAACLAVNSLDAAGRTQSPRAARVAPQDRGMWVTWYDLPEAGRSDYVAWLHETYIPGLLKRPGYLWAAHYAAHDRDPGGGGQIQHTREPIGAGYRYILLIGAEDAHVFGSPHPTQINASLPETGRRMLAMRQGERVNIAAEAGRCNGAGFSAYREGLTAAPVIQIGSFNCPVELEEEMHAGYVVSRLPSICATPTSVRTRKLNSVAGWAKHIILYEFASPEHFQRDYRAALAKSPLGVGGNSVVPKLVHAPNGPNSATRIWPPLSKTTR